MITNSSNCGGWVIARPEPIVYQTGETFGITLQSDHHIGAHDTDYEKMVRELDIAKAHGDRVVFNGDLFDLIFPFDSKRYSPDTLHPKLQGRRDVLNASLDFAFDLLAPYAEIIDCIGMGNHEASVEKYHSTDIVMLLIEKLQATLPAGSKHVIHYGGKLGFVQYKFRHRAGGNVRTIDLFYFHGAGGSAPVTKGMIDFNRTNQYVEADIIWLGHKHNRFIDTTPQRVRCPRDGDQPIVKPMIHVMTGGYRRGVIAQDQESMRRYGRQANYGTDMGLAPQGTGGARLLITIKGDGEQEIQAIQ